MSPRLDERLGAGRRRLVIVHGDSGNRLTVVEDPSGMYWKALHLPGSYALIAWWESGGWHEEQAPRHEHDREVKAAALREAADEVGMHISLRLRADWLRDRADRIENEADRG